MIRKTDIEAVVSRQLKDLDAQESYDREALAGVVDVKENFATIITGIRRCGKSTLVSQMMRQFSSKSLYLNFDTPRLFGFTIDDFVILDMVISDNNPEYLFFDEIQIVEGWELYVRGKLDEGYKVVVTGSNASLLGRELGTKLTGRHLEKTLFPFSFSEYVGFRGLDLSSESFNSYLNEGGFPAYLRTYDESVLENMYTDILYRDIMVRYNLRDEHAVKNLALFLMANVGNIVSATKLTQTIKVKTSKTVLEYFDYMENAYLFSFVRKFSYSFKSQVLNPRKVYAIDTGLQRVVSPSASADSGRRLENAVFLQLRRMGKDVYYYNDKGYECDFVVCEHGAPVSLIQVCEVLNYENEAREVNGLVEAMNALNVADGMILTKEQTDVIMVNGRAINVVPVWKWNGRIANQ